MGAQFRGSTAPRIRRLRVVLAGAHEYQGDSSAYTEIKVIPVICDMVKGRQLRVYGEPNTRVSSIRPRLLSWPSCPRPSSALYHLQTIYNPRSARQPTTLNAPHRTPRGSRKPH